MENLGNVFLVEGSDHRSKGWRFYNRIRIEDGKAYMEEANCPDGYCESRERSRHTQTIVCLPHKLVVEVLENENDQSFGTSDPEDVAPDTICKDKGKTDE